MKRSPLALVLACSCVFQAAGQQPAKPQAPATDQEEVVRITTNLVQVDAVVTDAGGKQVTDLGPADFEIYEDGRPQEIKNFSFVALQPASPTATPAPRSRNDAAAAPAPPVQLRPEQVRRTFALVVDDLGLSFESIYFVRKSLHKFVDEQVQPGDLVAVIRTGAGVGALQQFTTDKRLLHAAIDHIKFNAQTRSVGAFAPLEANTLDEKNVVGPSNAEGVSSTDLERAKGVEAGARAAERQYRDQIFSVGTLGALNFVIRGLRELPGRKSVVLMSDQLSLLDPQGGTDFRTLENVRRLTDLANRASTVIYTMDARGLQTLNIAAADGSYGTVGAPSAFAVGTPSQFFPGGDMIENRANDFYDSQTGLNYLARQTGGFFVREDNDLNHGLRRVLEDQKGFYLIGYRPEASTFDAKTARPDFHKLEVRLKNHPGLTVRTRTGFYGVPNEQARPAYRTREQQLLAAITSPFASGAVDMRLTSLFLNDTAYGSFVRSLIYVDARALTFTDKPDGTHEATVDVAAMTFGADGGIVDQRFRTETLRVRDEELRAALRDGLTFGINLPIQKPGAFQLRVAVRDAASARVGSANQFIEVPALGKNRLTLSGLYVAGSENHQQTESATQASGTSVPTQAGGTSLPSEAGAAEGRLNEADPQAGPAVRRFRAGALIDYGYEAYDARPDPASKRPHLTTQVRLFHDNRQVFAGKVLDIWGQPGSRRLVAFGHLQLGQNLAAGDYILQVVVRDLAGKDARLASQWLPFEITTLRGQP
jgi:VWFA-related protein